MTILSWFYININIWRVKNCKIDIFNINYGIEVYSHTPKIRNFFYFCIKSTYLIFMFIEVALRFFKMRLRLIRNAYIYVKSFNSLSKYFILNFYLNWKISYYIFTKATYLYKDLHVFSIKFHKIFKTFYYCNSKCFILRIYNFWKIINKLRITWYYL